jgi:predicted nicotinamide N-methyase
MMFSRVRSVGTQSINLYKPQVLPLDWTDREASLAIRTSSSVESSSPYFDFILMTDCVFNASLNSSIIATLREHSHSKTDIYCCYEIRDEVFDPSSSLSVPSSLSH